MSVAFNYIIGMCHSKCINFGPTNRLNNTSNLGPIPDNEDMGEKRGLIFSDLIYLYYLNM